MPIVSEEAVSVSIAESPEMRPVYAGIALASCASLLLELALTRLFSVVLFYHFAFLAISVALLGLGAGGVFACVFRERLGRIGLHPLGFWLCAANAAIIPLALEVILHLPVSLDISAHNFLRLTGVYMASAIPFFVTGFLFSVVFARQAQDISQLYGCDLAGGAAACLLVVPLLNFIGGPNAVLFSALLMAAAAILWSGNARHRKAAIALTVSMAMLIAANYTGRLVDIRYAKGKLRSKDWVLFAKWNAISRIEVDQQGLSKYIVIDADATSAIMNVDPAKWDASDTRGYIWKSDLMKAAPAVTNVLRPAGTYAIIGPGGGVDVLRAVASGSGNVTAVEINPIIATDVMRRRYADYSYHLYDRPDVHLHVGDGRSFIRNASEKYDVIQMTLVDTWASTAAGAFSLSENNLYTVEAFREYFEHLKPDGLLAITRWEFREPREALRVVSQAMQALHELGVADTRGNFLVVSDGPLDQDGRPVTVIAKRSPLSPGELQRVVETMPANIQLVYRPGDEEAAGSLLSRVSDPAGAIPATESAFKRLIESENPASFAARYPYNVSPVRDGAPFFFFTLKTDAVIRDIVAGTGRGMDWRINLGIVVLGIVLLISVAAVALFLILPLAVSAQTLGGGESPGLSIAYFVMVGLGYILVEVALIQRFVLFLGHPTYALTVVVFLLLLSSGAGSTVARRWELVRGMRLLRVLGAIVCLVSLLIAVVSYLLPAWVGLPFALKLLVSALVLTPLGFLMGMPFPTGLATIHAEPGRIEWAWAMNAAASVLGSVLAMVIAIHFGFNTAQFCGAVAYGVAALAFIRYSRRNRATV